jgi:hypothetical protein
MWLRTKVKPKECTNPGNVGFGSAHSPPTLTIAADTKTIPAAIGASRNKLDGRPIPKAHSLERIEFQVNNICGSVKLKAFDNVRRGVEPKRVSRRSVAPDA